MTKPTTTAQLKEEQTEKAKGINNTVKKVGENQKQRISSRSTNEYTMYKLKLMVAYHFFFEVNMLLSKNI